ncbi:hypothetical protein [Massilia sp. CCM 8734]|nr:hypothetical protein [Massilia sp. CCM 8734]
MARLAAQRAADHADYEVVHDVALQVALAANIQPKRAKAPK